MGLCRIWQLQLDVSGRIVKPLGKGRRAGWLWKEQFAMLSLHSGPTPRGRAFSAASVQHAADARSSRNSVLLMFMALGGSSGDFARHKGKVRRKQLS